MSKKIELLCAHSEECKNHPRSASSSVKVASGGRQLPFRSRERKSLNVIDLLPLPHTVFSHVVVKAWGGEHLRSQH